ncbi:unnamed protein product [Ectocarpus sp. CCAP 1310/34]|nr:unnamed protein product [Ectocarpus sp. CCAP 1310/34]
MRGSEVPVGATGMDLNWLRSTYGEERVKQPRKIWTFMLAKITAQPVQAQILAAESPQAGYRVFIDQYSQDKSQERQNLDDAWNVIGQRQGESLMDYYGRAVALWMRLRSYGDYRDEKSMCRHIVRGFLPRFEKTKDRLLFDTMLSRATMQEMLRMEEHELRYERRDGERKEEMRHALVAAGVGRGGGAGKPAAAGSEQGGHRPQQPQGSLPLHQQNQQQPSHFCQLHGPNSTHETSECEKLRNEFIAHYNEFCAYMSGRREAQGFVFPRGGAQHSGRMVGGPSRQQPYQNEQGAGWSRGHSPALPGPPRGPGSGAGGQLQGRNSGGRGHGGYGPYPPENRGRQADSGASAMISNKVDAMYNVRHLGPDEQFIQIGDSALIKVAAVGSLDLRFHQIGADGKQEDLDVTVPEVLFVPGCGFNLFSVWKVSHKHEVRINPNAEYSAKMIDVWESDECERAMAVLGPEKTPFNVGNARKVMDINTFHYRASHLSEPILRLSVKHHGITLTGTMDSCRWCLPARGTRAPVPKQGGGYRGKRAPNDVFHIDLCGAYTATIGGNHYMLFGVDAATGWMACYAMRRKSEALGVVKRMVVDAAHKAGTAIKCIRCDCDALWTSGDFKEFCDGMGIALEYSPPGVQQYNGVVESAIQRCLKDFLVSAG